VNNKVAYFCRSGRAIQDRPLPFNMVTGKNPGLILNFLIKKSLILVLLCLKVLENQGQTVTLTSSNLPVIIINTPPGQTIRNEPKISADMKIIHNGEGSVNHVTDTGNVYSGNIGIEIRGHYSASLPQKPYGIETRDAAGSNLNTSLFGMPPENDWVLLANYNDKTFLRNFLAFELSREMGHYAPRMKYCEVIVNNEYQGIYLFGEKIKRDDGRLDISKLEPFENSGDDLTGGYIFKNDYYTASDSWKSNFSPLNKPGGSVYFVYYEPEPGDISAQQKNYLQTFINFLETTLYSGNFKNKTNGYRAYLDIGSFADHFIIGEVSRNIDAYKKSRFYYKDRDSKNPLLHSGPEWDYDWAWKNIRENCDLFDKTDGSGWAYKVNECNNKPLAPSWEVRLLQDSAFANHVNRRYFSLRKSVLSETYIFSKIDSVVSILNESQLRHFDKWRILGINVGTPEVDEQPSTYEGEIEKLKKWISTRLGWLDKNMVGNAGSQSPDTSNVIYRLFPNPASDILYVESNREISRVNLINLSGITVMEMHNIGDFTASIDITSISAGFYIAKIYLKDGAIINSRFIKE